MLEKCPECGENLKDNSIVVWRCNNCNKGFKGSSQFLQNLQKKKDDNPGKSLLKCNNCGNWLDDGKEDISVKCSSCGNVIKGNLGYFIREKEIINNSIKNKRNNNKLNVNLNKRKWRIGIILSVSIMLLIYILFPIFKQKKIESSFIQSRKDYEDAVKQLKFNELYKNKYILSVSINTDFESNRINSTREIINQTDMVDISITLSDDFEDKILKDECKILYKIAEKINNILDGIKKHTGYNDLEKDYIIYKKQYIYVNEELNITYSTNLYEYKFGNNRLFLTDKKEHETEEYDYKTENGELVSLSRRKEELTEKSYSWNKKDEPEDYKGLTYYKVTNDSELTEAWLMAQELVKKHLNHPKTATFPYYKNDNLSIKKSGNYYEIVGYVDAENSFGVEIRTAFSLIMEKTGSSYVEKEFFYLE